MTNGETLSVSGISITKTVAQISKLVIYAIRVKNQDRILGYFEI